MKRKFYVGTNTKMYKTVKDTVEFITKMQDLTSDISREDMELFVIPSFTAQREANLVKKEELLKIGAQNMGWEEQGQFTGEISPIMLQECGTDIVMVGHSERRHIFREKDEEENKKVLCALSHGFTLLLCVGETEEEKNYGISEEIIRMQIKKGLFGVNKDQIGRLWIAYEPVWAIGEGGKPAKKEYAEQIHTTMRKVLTELFGKEGEQIPLLYGGSVNAENAPGLAKMEHIDGLFIGRAAWQADRFNRIIRSALAESMVRDGGVR